MGSLGFFFFKFLRSILTTFEKEFFLKKVGKGLKFYHQILPNPIITAKKSSRNHANMGVQTCAKVW